MRLRQKLESSEWLAWALGGLVALWLRLCFATTRWQRHGEDALFAALAQGPVVLVIWHEATLFAPQLWPRRRAAIASLRDTSPIGRVSGAVQGWFGLRPVAMSSREGNLAASRAVLRQVAEGVSVGLTGDGPLGPAQVLKRAPLDWARATGRPVFVLGWGTTRMRRLNTWDRMQLPLPFARGVAVFRQWSPGLPRRATPAEQDSQAEALCQALTEVAREAQAGLATIRSR